MERLTEGALRRYQKGLLGLYLKRLRYRGDVELFGLAFASGDERRQATVLAARMRLPCDDDSSLWCTASLGIQGEAALDHEHQFLSILDESSLDVADWVASAYHYDRYVERLGHGHTFPLPKGGRMARRGYAGTLILNGDFYQHFARDLGQVSGTATTLFAVVPVTESELTSKREQGLDKLLKEWERSGRDALHLSMGSIH